MEISIRVRLWQWWERSDVRLATNWVFGGSLARAWGYFLILDFGWLVGPTCISCSGIFAPRLLQHSFTFAEVLLVLQRECREILEEVIQGSEGRQDAWLSPGRAQIHEVRCPVVIRRGRWVWVKTGEMSSKSLRQERYIRSEPVRLG